MSFFCRALCLSVPSLICSVFSVVSFCPRGSHLTVQNGRALQENSAALSEPPKIRML